MLDGRFDQHFAEIFAGSGPGGADESTRGTALAAGLFAAVVAVGGLTLVAAALPPAPSPVAALSPGQ